MSRDDPADDGDTDADGAADDRQGKSVGDGDATEERASTEGSEVPGDSRESSAVGRGDDSTDGVSDGDSADGERPESDDQIDSVDELRRTRRR